MELFGALIAAVMGRTTLFVLLYIIWLIIFSMMSKLKDKQEKLPNKTDTEKDDKIIAVVSGAAMVYQESYNKFAIRKITEKSKVEERLVTPIGPIVNRKY